LGAINNLKELFTQTATASKDEFEKLKAEMEMLNNLLGAKAEVKE